MKRILLYAVILAMLLGLSACANDTKDSQDTETHEFLCAFAEPSRRLQSESGFWYYLKDDGRVARWTFMEDIQKNRVESNVVFELKALETEGEGDDGIIYLNYTLTNGMDYALSPAGKVEIAVLLKDGWYIMPNVPVADFGEMMAAGEVREDRLEIGTLDKSYLPDGHYRIQLKIDELSYAYLEFDMENAAGEMRMSVS